ncbi:MAG: tRNA (cytidine(34)-2'-O)-methyltransferase [Tenericutes bacterium ADurb.Bin087]|nr:MAG: tRNA (cytidine(34)-2'-O)-methyltransferase [Tenericutes bacterium ADurb.Bin087]
MLHIILYQPEMPANVGNVMRTVVAIDATLHIIGPTPIKFDDKNLKRAGMDYVKDLSFFIYESLADFIKKHHDKNIVYVTRYSSNNYTDVDYGRFDDEVFVMFGNESYGLPLELLRQHKEKTVRIPMVASARSLNLSNAVAIVSYEILRQQGFYNLATSEIIKGDDYL